MKIMKILHDEVHGEKFIIVFIIRNSFTIHENPAKY